MKFSNEIMFNYGVVNCDSLKACPKCDAKACIHYGFSKECSARKRPTNAMIVICDTCHYNFGHMTYDPTIEGEYDITFTGMKTAWNQHASRAAQ
jgi:hypothetical protein